ncbi:MAG: hypothetical protein AB7P03_24065 [Kofleriaceae bacterium]
MRLRQQYGDAGIVHDDEPQPRPWHGVWWRDPNIPVERRGALRQRYGSAGVTHDDEVVQNTRDLPWWETMAIPPPWWR